MNVATVKREQYDNVLISHFASDVICTELAYRLSVVSQGCIQWILEVPAKLHTKISFIVYLFVQSPKKYAARNFKEFFDIHHDLAIEPCFVASEPQDTALICIQPLDEYENHLYI